MKLFVTIYEETSEAAIAAIRALEFEHDGIEVRAERFPSIDFAPIRAATRKPLLLTWRNVDAMPPLETALAAGIDLVDVEWRDDLDRELLRRFGDRIVLSHHDYDGMREVERVLDAMLAFGCRHVKLAATPHDFASNLRLLRMLEQRKGGSFVSVIGMGERGLYSRILAPFRGSALTFVAGHAVAAPGQLTLSNALSIYGSSRESLRAREVFAVVGNPAGHSLSPSIHNRLFREKGVDAAYTIASIDRFDEIVEAFRRGEPMGLSVTTPFKEDALRFAEAAGAQVGRNAVECGSVNTLVNDGRTLVADNTDVDGFEQILRRICGRDQKSVAIVGAGGTARAALVAARRAGMHVTVFNRTEGKLDARPFAELERWDGEVLIDATSADLDFELRPGMSYVRARYGGRSTTLEKAAAHGTETFDGLDLLEAQAVRQNELFIEAIRRKNQ